MKNSNSLLVAFVASAFVMVVAYIKDSTCANIGKYPVETPAYYLK